MLGRDFLRERVRMSKVSLQAGQGFLSVPAKQMKEQDEENVILESKQS